VEVILPPVTPRLLHNTEPRRHPPPDLAIHSASSVLEPAWNKLNQFIKPLTKGIRSTSNHHRLNIIMLICNLCNLYGMPQKKVHLLLSPHFH